MTEAQLERVPTRILLAPGTAELRRFLDARGWRMTLLELSQERRRRSGLSPDLPELSRTQRRRNR